MWQSELSVPFHSFESIGLIHFCRSFWQIFSKLLQIFQNLRQGRFQQNS